MAVNAKCWLCKRPFNDNDLIVPILRYVTNPKRGDFASTQATEHVHASHLTQLYPGRYECSSCRFNTNDRHAIKNHAAVLGHFGWGDREAPTPKENNS